MSKKLILCRGLPGSGKSYLAKELGQGKSYSTDDFFVVNGEYRFNLKLIGKAHEWNQNRVKMAMVSGEAVVVVDNTMTQKWEMLPYVKMAQEYGYEVEIREPSWHPDLKKNGKWNVDFLVGRNVHGVNRDILEKMIARYEYDVTKEMILNLLED